MHAESFELQPGQSAELSSASSETSQRLLEEYLSPAVVWTRTSSEAESEQKQSSTELPAGVSKLEQTETETVVQDDSLSKARLNLESQAGSLLTGKKERERFKESMVAFEDRAVKRGLPASEISETYTQISRLMDSPGEEPVQKSWKLVLAQQVLAQAANPTKISQGAHKTCGVATVEARVYTRNPSAAARLVADVATTGKYKSPGGTTITLDKKSLEPDWEGDDKTPGDGTRSYASQLFQVTAVNIRWFHADRDADGKIIKKGDIRYEQRDAGPLTLKMSNDSGERLLDHSKNPPKELARQPKLTVTTVLLISNDVTGLNESTFVVENKMHGMPLTNQVASEAELKAVLSQMKQEGRLPAVVRVHTDHSPFSSPLRPDRQGTWHLLSVTDYDESKGVTQIDNQWRLSSDIKMKVSDLYKATLPPPVRSNIIMDFNNPFFDVSF